MRQRDFWKPLAIGVCNCGSIFAACSSGNSDTGSGSGSGGSSGGSGGGSGSSSGTSGSSSGGGACVLQVVFAPSYSAYESSHTYQIPFIVTNGNMTGTNAVTWTSSDSTVALAAGTDQLGNNLEMATINGQPAGPVTITATDPTGACASSTSTLTVTPTTAELWEEGYERYTSGEVITRPDAAGFQRNEAGQIIPPEGGFQFDAAGIDSGGLECTNCHEYNGTTNPNAPFKDVQHTPEQTGGFSDTELQNIFLNGEIPDGGYFDPSVICGDASTCTFERAYGVWQNIHHWSMSSDEAQGMITFLRSLTPAGQTGSSNFGGHGHHDGGTGGPPPGSSSGGSGSSSGGTATDASPE